MILPVISIWLVAKVFLCFAIFLYIVFAFVIVRQVSIMLATLELGFETRLGFCPGCICFLLSLFLFWRF